MAEYAVQPDTGRIRRTSDGFIVPLVYDDPDYQAFCAWSAAGNATDTDPPDPHHCAAATVAQRLDAKGKLTGLARLLTLGDPVDPADQDARAIIQALGEDPDEILAPDVI